MLELYEMSGYRGILFVTSVQDQIVRALIETANVRVVTAVTAAASREAARRHGVVAGAAVALSRGASAGLLLATLTKGGETVTVRVLGNGPLGGVTVDANDQGDVRAYLQSGSVLVGGGSDRISLSAAIGRQGLVSVIRDLGMKEKYSGQAPMVTGEIDEDIENYLRTSEQISSALGCEAVLAPDSTIRAAGGVLVQCMPGGDGVTLVREVQHRMRTGELYRALNDSSTHDAVALAHSVLSGFKLDVLDTRSVQFSCPCSRDRVLSMVHTLSENDLDEMCDEGHAQVICDFCREPYEITVDELQEIRKQHRDRPRAKG